MAKLTVFVSAAPADAAFTARLLQAIVDNKGEVVSSPPLAPSPASPPESAALPQRDLNSLAGAQAFVSVLTPAALADGRTQAEAQRYVATDAGKSKHIVVPVQLDPLPPNAVWPALQGVPPVTGPYGKPELQDVLIAETLKRLGLPPKRNWALLLIAALLALLLLACCGVLVIAPGGALHPIIAGSKPSGAPRLAPTAIPSATATPTPVGTGLLGQYYRSQPYSCCMAVPDDVYGQLLYTEVDPQINIRVNGDEFPDPRLSGGAYAIHWTGSIRPQYSETYTFVTHSDDGVRLWINGQLLIDDWSTHAEKVDQNTITLSAGQLYSIKLDYYQNAEGHGGIITLQWQSASQPLALVPQSALYPPANS